MQSFDNPVSFQHSRLRLYSIRVYLGCGEDLFSMGNSATSSSEAQIHIDGGIPSCLKPALISCLKEFFG